MKYRQITWNIPESIYKRFLETHMGFVKYSVVTFPSEETFGIYVLETGLNLAQSELNRRMAPSIILP